MNEASNYVEGVDKAFWFILGIDIFFLVGLTATMLFFVFKYRRSKHPKPVQVKEKMWVELTWFVVPLALVLAMFFYGYVAFIDMRKVPDNALKVTAIGRMWDWLFIYENGKESNKLVVPVGKPVVLSLQSADVVHSLYIPAFRIKEDMVPGKTDNYMWFLPTIKDTFDIFCAEYCGVRHSYMVTSAIVVDDTAFASWVAKVEKKQAKDSMPGYFLLRDNACLACHSLDGSKLVGPTFKGLFGAKRKVLADDNEIEVVADTTYIKNSILDPGEYIVKGYPKGTMQSYKTVFKERDIQDIIEFFKADKEQ